MMQKDKRLLYFFFLVAAIGVFLLTHYTTLCFDDFGYKLILSPNGFSNDRVRGFSDLIYSQYNHYLIHNGRVFVHFLVQLFLIPDTKIAFDIANGVVFFVFQLFFFKLIRKDLSSISPFFYLFFLLLFWFWMPATNYCLLWLSCSVNYLWAITFVMAFLLIHRKIEDGWKIPPIYFPFIWLFSFLSGGSQELITIPLSISLLLYYIIRIGDFRISLLSASIPFWLGTLFISLAPGNGLRMIRQQVDHHSISKIIESIGGFVFSYGELKIFWLLIVALLIFYVLKKDLISAFFREHFIVVSTIFFSMLFLIYLGYSRPRFFFPISFFSLMLLILFVDRQFRFLFDSWFVKLVLILPFALVFMQFSNSITELKKYKRAFTTLENKIKSSNKTYFKLPNSARTNFFCGGLGKDDRHFWINTSMSSLYHKKELVFLPNELYSFFIQPTLDKRDSMVLAVDYENVTKKITAYFLPKSKYVVIPFADSLYSEEPNLVVQFHQNNYDNSTDLRHRLKVFVFGSEKISTNVTIPFYSLKTSAGTFLYFKLVDGIQKKAIQQIRVVQKDKVKYNFKGVPS